MEEKELLKKLSDAIEANGFKVNSIKFIRNEDKEEDEDNPLTWHRQRARELGENVFTGD